MQCCCWEIRVWNYVYFTRFNTFFYLERWLCLSLDSHCHSEGHSRGQGIVFRTFRQQRQDKSLRTGLSIVSGESMEAVNDTFLLFLFSLALSKSILSQYGSSLMGGAQGKVSMKLLSPKTGQWQKVNNRKFYFKRGDYMDEPSKQCFSLHYPEPSYSKSWIFPPLFWTMYANV